MASPNRRRSRLWPARAAGGVLPDDPHHRVPGLLGRGVVGDAPAGHLPDGEEGQKAHRQLHRRQGRLQQKGQDQSPQHQHGGPDAAPLHLVEHLVDVVGVVGQPGHQRGGGKAVHLGAGEALGPAVQVPPQGPGHLHGHPRRHAVGGDVAKGRPKGQSRHQSAAEPDGGQVSGRDAHVHNALQQQRQHQLQQRGGELHRHAAGHPNAVGPQVSQYGAHLSASLPLLSNHTISRRQVNPQIVVVRN